MPLGVLRPGPSLVIVVSRPSGWANCEVAPPPRQRARCISSPAAVTTRVPLAFAFGQKGRGEASPAAGGTAPLAHPHSAGNQVPRAGGLCAGRHHRTSFSRLQPPITPPDLEPSLTPCYVLLSAFKCPLRPRTVEQSQAPSSAPRPLPAGACDTRRGTPPAGRVSAPVLHSVNTCQSRFVPETPLELLHSRSPTTSPLPHPLNVLCPGFRPQTRRAPPPSCKAFT